MRFLTTKNAVVGVGSLDTTPSTIAVAYMVTCARARSSAAQIQAIYSATFRRDYTRSPSAAWDGGQAEPDR